MADTQTSRPILHFVAPRFQVGNQEQALAFYGQLGFAMTYQDEGLAIVERDGVALHLHSSEEPPTTDHLVGWIRVTNIEALYQEYLPTNAVSSPVVAQPWGFNEFHLSDPWKNLFIFAEALPEEKKGQQHMATTSMSRPTLISIAPRLQAGDMEQALAFYAQLGFATTDRDGEFAIVERDGVSLHFNVSDGHSVCWISVTNIEALYQQYQEYLPTNGFAPRISPRVVAKPWGMKEFHICDPFRNFLLFGEGIPEEEAS